MSERYIVYLRNTGNKLFETDTLESAASFIDMKNYEKRLNGDSEFEKYEIVMVTRKEW